MLLIPPFFLGILLTSGRCMEVWLREKYSEALLAMALSVGPLFITELSFPIHNTGPSVLCPFVSIKST